MALNEGLIFEALKQVYDPEIPKGEKHNGESSKNSRTPSL